MTAILNDPQTRMRLDAQDMLGRIENFRQQCMEGEQIARSFPWPSISDIRNILICGMGGSAIGGDLMRAYASQYATVPIEVNRNYNLPRYVDSHSLVIISSYSGNTEESLSACEQAKERGARLLGLTTGGALCRCLDRDGAPCLILPGGFPPRAALGYSFVSLLVAMESLGIIPNQSEALRDFYQTLETVALENSFDVPTERNPSKQLAQTLHKKFPILYAGQDAFQPVAIRWKGQFNENSKILAHDATVPEMNHNEILGWSWIGSFLKQCHVVYLMDCDYHPQTCKRFRAMSRSIKPVADGITEVHSQGQSLLARMFSLILLGDFTSVYLAYLNEVDPTPMQAIEDLKAELKK